MRRWLVLLLLVSVVSAQPQHRACEEPFSGPDFNAIVPGDVLLADVGYGFVVIDDAEWSWQDGRLPYAGPEGYATPGDMGGGFAIHRAGHADCACMTTVYLYGADGEVLREWPTGSHVYDMGGQYAVVHIDAVSLVAPSGSVQDIAMPAWDGVYGGGSWDVQRADDRLLIVNGALQAAWITPASGEVAVVALRDEAATAEPQIHMAG